EGGEGAWARAGPLGSSRLRLLDAAALRRGSQDARTGSGTRPLRRMPPPIAIPRTAPLSSAFPFPPLSLEKSTALLHLTQTNADNKKVFCCRYRGGRSLILSTFLPAERNRP